MLEVENLEVVYEDVILVLKGVSLRVPEGQIVPLLGANGAGKTTTLRAVTGLLDIHRGEITKGRIHLDGERIDGLPPEVVVKKGVSQVTEGRPIFQEFTVEENLRVGAHTSRAELTQNFDRVFGLFPVLAQRRKRVVEEPAAAVCASRSPSEPAVPLGLPRRAGATTPTPSVRQISAPGGTT